MANNALSGNGTTGANLGAWRFRADWQSRVLIRLPVLRLNANGTGAAIAPIAQYRAWAPSSRWVKIFLNSAIFDNFRFSGGEFSDR